MSASLLPIGGQRDPAPVMIAVEQLRRSVPGGIGTAAAGLLQGLAEGSNRVRSGLVLYASVPAGATAKTPQADPLWQYDIPLLATALPNWLVTRMWEHGRGAPRHKVSLLHATSFQYPPVDAPLVSTVHDLAWRHVPETYGAHGRRWHETALRRVLANASAFVVPSPSVADDLDAASPGLDRPIEVVPWGADHLPPPDATAGTALLASLGVTGPIVLTVSTIEPRKNLARLIEAFGAARTAIGDAPTLLVVGPQGWGGGVTARDGVVLAGKVDAGVLSYLFQQALAFFYVPLLEGFGLPVLEAMHAGTPVLSSGVPSAAGATLLVDPLDVGSIRDGIVTICREEGVRNDLVRRATAIAAEHTWAEVARRHVELWRRLGGDIPSE